MSFWNDFLPGGKTWDNFMSGGASGASSDINEAMNDTKHYLDPYWQHGQDAYNQLNPEYQSMMNDPTGFLNNIMSKYQQSDAFKQQLGDALNSAKNAAAAGGMQGSISDIQNQENLTNKLTSQNMQQYLQNVLGIQGQGMGGLQNFYNQGLSAGNAAASNLGTLLGEKGQLNEQGWSNGMGMIGNLAGLVGGFF